MVNTHIETILIITGLATALAIIQCVVPRPILRFAFGIETPQPVTLLIASHWGLLIFLIGALLVYAAFQPSVRGPSMIIGSVEKLFLAALVFFGDMPKTGRTTALAVIDTGIATLYLMYFAGL
jgi:hypothetical protein